MKNTASEWTLWYKDPETGKKKPFRVRPLVPGYRDIVVDRLGQVYCKRWNGNQKLQATGSPKERADIIWDSKDIIWPRYEYGVVELARAMKNAILSGAKEIPTWERIQNLCGQTSVKLYTLSEFTPAERRNIKKQLSRAILKTEGRHRKELKEVNEQLSFVLPLRDSKGRLNVTVLQTRLNAASVRLLERIRGIATWRPALAMRLMIAEDIRDQGFAMVRRIAEHNEARAGHQIIKSGVFQGKQAEFFCRHADRDLADLDDWKALHPFSGWAVKMRADLRDLKKAVRAGSVQEARSITQRIHEASKLKLLQLDLYTTLEEFSIALHLKSQFPKVRMQQNIEELACEIKQINDKDWRYPVVNDIVREMRRSYHYLNRGKFEKGKDALREASRIF